MDPKFQTSFIPKQALSQGPASYRPKGGINLFVLIALIIFFGVGAAAGGLYIYQKSLETSIASINTRLSAARADIDPALVSQLERLDTRINSAKDILSKHRALTTFFKDLEAKTLKGVSFQSFDYSQAEQNGLRVSMKGQATSFNTVALESDLIMNDKSLVNPLFSDIGLDPLGNVVFTLSFDIDPAAIMYSQTLSATAGVPITQTISTNVSTTSGGIDQNNTHIQ